MKKRYDKLNDAAYSALKYRDCTANCFFIWLLHIVLVPRCVDFRCPAALPFIHIVYLSRPHSPFSIPSPQIRLPRLASRPALSARGAARLGSSRPIPACSGSLSSHSVCFRFVSFRFVRYSRSACSLSTPTSPYLRFGLLLRRPPPRCSGRRTGRRRPNRISRRQTLR